MPSDMWAVGVTIYRLLSGHFPFSDALEITTRSPANFPDWVPEYLSTMLMRMLDKDPNSRLTCQQAIDVLFTGKFDEAVSIPQEPSRERKLEECIEQQSEIGTNEEQRRFLARNLPRDAQRSRLIYSSKQQGWEKDEFHKYCDNRGMTLALIKSQKD